ncbi:MAG TPA: hypothetical protein VGD40_01805 [Chryseosolibacter sp.]
MKRLILRFFIFCTISTALYLGFNAFVLPVLLEKAFGPTVEEQLDNSFSNALARKYDLLILGNSKFYCGVNPDKFTIPAFNFSHNNDSYNQLYYKLEWIYKNGKKIKYLVLGTDYFQFNIFSDTRNYAYGKYLGSEYLADYDNKISLRTQLEVVKPYKARRLLQFPYDKHGLKDNGQFIRTGVASDEDFIKRRFGFLDLQVKYFDRILQFSRDHGIVVFICMPPLRKEELEQYTERQIADFRGFVNKRAGEDIYFLDSAADPSFQTSDFIDFAHLNQAAADRYSEKIDREIHSRLDIFQ